MRSNNLENGLLFMSLILFMNLKSDYPLSFILTAECVRFEVCNMKFDLLLCMTGDNFKKAFLPICALFGAIIAYFRTRRLVMQSNQLSRVTCLLLVVLSRG